jgi:drug/metabolite transporter (DMT)-like permease
VDPLVIGLVVGSAVLHVAWNVRIKTADDQLRMGAVGILAASLLIAPIAVVAWLLTGRPELPPLGIALGLGSGVVETAYFVFLAAAYRRGDLSVVYPIARGVAPLLLVGVGVVVFGERLAWTGWLGVACLVAGFLALQRPWRALGAASRSAGRDSAVTFALLTGVTIALYTAIDRAGTRLIPPLQYAAILWPTAAILLVAWLRFVERRPLLSGAPGQLRDAAVVGVLTLSAYLLVLVALSVAPLTAVAPLRESAAVVAAGWGAIRLREAADRADATRRIVASAVIVVGAVLLALPG